MNQNERRRWLIHALLEEMPQYEYPVFPYTADRQWRLLRSLMNVRPPMPVSEEFLQIQDAFLKDRTVKKFLRKDTCIQRAIFNVFKDSDLEIYRNLLK